MSQAIPPSSEIDLLDQTDSFSFPQKSDPDSQVSLSLAQRIVDVLNPETVLILVPDSNSADAASGPLGTASTSYFLEQLGVKTTSSEAQGLQVDARFDLALFVCPDSEVLYKGRELILAATQACGQILVVSTTAKSVDNQYYTFAKSISDIASELFDRGYLRDVTFKVPMVGLQGNLYCKSQEQDLKLAIADLIAGYESETTLLMAERDRLRVLEIESFVRSDETAFSDLQAQDLAASLVEKSRALEILNAKLDDVTQQMYMARDAVAGAEAEKARADGVSAELRYLINMKDQETLDLLEELEAYEMKASGKGSKVMDMRLHQTQGGDPQSVKEKNLRHRVGKGIVKVLARVRQRSRDN